MINLTASPDRDLIYAYTSAAKEKKTQLIWIQLSAYDRVPQHFWRNFMSSLSVWDVQFVQNKGRNGFPATACDIKQFMDSLAQAVRNNPLIIVANNIQRISGTPGYDLLRKLISVQTCELFVILLFDQNQPARISKDTEINIVADKNRWFTEEEEMEYYKKNGILLTESEFQQMRSFSEGLAATVIMLTHHHLLVEDKRKILDNPVSYLNKWMEQEYFNQYNQEERHLLTCLSLLDDFSADMVQQFSGWDGHMLLEALERSPFVMSHPGTCRFSYSSFCKSFFQKFRVLLSNKQRHDFYIKVGDWYQEQGNQIEAISYYRIVRASHRILQTMQKWTFPNSRETAVCYIEAINEMPAGFLEKHPFLQVVRCHMLGTLYRYQESEKLLEEFCARYDQGDDTPQELRTTLGEAYTVWGNSGYILQPDASVALPRFRRAAQLLPNGSSLISARMNLFADSPMIRLTSPEAGSMKRNAEFLFQMSPYIEQLTGGGWTGSASLAMAELNYYTRNFREVEGNARNAIAAAEDKEQYDIVCSAYFLLMRLNLAKGNYVRLMESHQLLRQVADKASYHTFFSMPDLADSWLYLKLGKKHKVANWIINESLYQKKIKPWNYGRDRIIRCYYFLSNRQYEDVLNCANTAIDLFRKRNFNLLCLQLLIMKAVALNGMGELQQSVDVMEEVYRWSHNNELVMPIVEYGSFVGPLIENCQKAAGCAIPSRWLEDIRRKANSYYVYQNNIRKLYEQKKRLETSLLEKLTGTEQRMLLMICHGMKAREIAEQQGKTISAVKGMARRIYAKIGAEGMADAVRIAMECNIEEQVQL